MSDDTRGGQGGSSGLDTRVGRGQTLSPRGAAVESAPRSHSAAPGDAPQRDRACLFSGLSCPTRMLLVFDDVSC